jgi:probable HAF family extracellular repeat protein
MTVRTTACLLGLLVFGVPNGIRGADLDTTSFFDIPGASNTVPLSINADGVIVGRCRIGGLVHGFVRDPMGNFTIIDVPGANFTVAAALNNRGDIVGMYGVPTSSTGRHGYLLKDGVFSTFDPPGSTFTNALGINDRGDVVGRYAVGNQPEHGFLLQDGRFTTLDVPGATRTDAFGINDREEVVGGFLTTDGHSQIFVFSDGAYSMIVPPGQNVSLDKGAINARGDIVGQYCDALFPCSFGAGLHGFLYSADGFTTIDVPGASGTAVFGINAAGTIVGSYIDAHGAAHGFRVTRGDN